MSVGAHQQLLVYATYVIPSSVPSPISHIPVFYCFNISIQVAPRYFTDPVGGARYGMDHNPRIRLSIKFTKAIQGTQFKCWPDSKRHVFIKKNTRTKLTT